MAIFLMGPTASGKTELAVELVQRLPLEIISVDSAMVYRGMDIGTGKPDAALLARAPHRLIDIRDPESAYSAGEFRADAQREVQAVLAAGRVPLLVGGTGLYFRALRDGLAGLPRAEPAVRRRLAAEAARHGWGRLHERLARLDAPAAARIHPNDPQRIQRALEVHELTGRPLSELQRAQAAAPGAPALDLPVLALALYPADRSVLHDRIDARFRRMLERGLVEEVSALRARSGMHPSLPSMRAVGYRQVWAHLDGRLAREAMIREALRATRGLAKRQLTWLRSEPQAERLDSADPRLLDRALARVAAALGAARSRAPGGGDRL